MRSDAFCFGRRGRPGSPLDLKRRTFRPGILAVVAAGRAVALIALSPDVAPGNVAAAARHLTEAHPVANGVVICRIPCPGAVDLLEPPSEPAPSPAIASSA